MSNGGIDPTAVVSPLATVGEGVVIGPHAVVYDSADIADGVWIGAGAVIAAPAEIRGSSHFGWPRSTEGLFRTVIGSGTVIREHVVVGQGVEGDTVIGRDGYIMNGAYVAHDCFLGEQVTLASGTRLAGHVWLGRGANLGLNVSVHQRRRIGGGAMIGMGAVVTHDVRPFAKAYGNPARVVGANVFRLRALGLSEDECARVAAILDGGTDGDAGFGASLLDGESAEALGPDLRAWATPR
jgi:UDP-N-acetylglucosamine acyltransferase